MLYIQKKIAFVLLFFAITFSCLSQTLQYDVHSSRQRYATSKLAELFQHDKSAASFTIRLVVDTTAYAFESFTITQKNKIITVTGGSERALIYGCLSIAEDVRNGVALKDCKQKNEKAFLPFRAIKYDLPWDSYRHSYALSLHDETCRDTAYWKAFLDMMAENRFNAITLWNLHPYTFLIKPKKLSRGKPME